jgi:hypothetical protein
LPFEFPNVTDSKPDVPGKETALENFYGEYVLRDVDRPRVAEREANSGAES